MTLKDRISKVLKRKGISYDELCDNLELSNSDLDKLIEDKNIKALEMISKILGIPLYSFYNNPKDILPSMPTTKHYNEDIWKDDESK